MKRRALEEHPRPVRQEVVILQLGHNRDSAPALHNAREIYRSGTPGAVPLIRACIEYEYQAPDAVEGRRERR